MFRSNAHIANSVYRWKEQSTMIDEHNSYYGE